MRTILIIALSLSVSRRVVRAVSLEVPQAPSNVVSVHILGRSREPDAYVHVDASPGSLESGTAHMCA